MPSVALPSIPTTVASPPPVPGPTRAGCGPAGPGPPSTAASTLTPPAMPWPRHDHPAPRRPTPSSFATRLERRAQVPSIVRRASPPPRWRLILAAPHCSGNTTTWKEEPSLPAYNKWINLPQQGWISLAQRHRAWDPLLRGSWLGTRSTPGYRLPRRWRGLGSGTSARPKRASTTERASHPRDARCRRSRRRPGEPTVGAERSRPDPAHEMPQLPRGLGEGQFAAGTVPAGSGRPRKIAGPDLADHGQGQRCVPVCAETRSRSP